MSRGAAAGAAEVRHPIFARLFDRLSGLMEKEVGGQRDELLAGLSGRVVEIGAGNGINFGHYPATVDEVVASEPEAYLRSKAEEAARDAPVPVVVSDAAADPLPFGEASFDAAVASVVLCTVPDQLRALEELRRVLKPGGELRFMEHVRADGRRKARVQDWLDRSGIWPRVAGGCHCARDTVARIEAAGFAVERVRSFDLGPSWLHTNPHVLGAASAPGAGPLLAHHDLIRRCYAAFNARDLDAALEGVHPDVDWPNAIDGGRVRGHEEVRAYWTRQFETTDPRVEPQAFSEDEQGRIVVDVHQVIRDLDGGVIADQHVQHVHTISAGLIARMNIRQEPNQE